MRKAVAMALAGNAVAMRLCLERVLPLLQDRPVVFKLPPIESPADLPEATAGLLRAVTSGELTPGEAEALRKVIDTHIAALKLVDVTERLTNLEDEKQQ
ncbi:hypothetical protein U8607_23475 [Methylobacterium durans]|uniref:hypothetical protein n=1 Tax=Methylobacterium durans TaxID=2202825 RepID=UPI002AFE1C0D|nr:hypothetical protein [Methylobacterium durans]MEA1835055.1 hypothetical protein [Methylobacterium durans]